MGAAQRLCLGRIGMLVNMHSEGIKKRAFTSIMLMMAVCACVYFVSIEESTVMESAAVESSVEHQGEISEGEVSEGVHMVAIYPHKERQTTATEVADMMQMSSTVDMGKKRTKRRQRPLWKTMATCSTTARFHLGLQPKSSKWFSTLARSSFGCRMLRALTWRARST